MGQMTTWSKTGPESKRFHYTGTSCPAALSAFQISLPMLLNLLTERAPRSLRTLLPCLASAAALNVGSR